jgi:hypothetical protein
MGKPVISCRIPVVEQMFGNLIYFADTPEDFLQQAGKSLSENTLTLEVARINAASEHTWDSKFELITRIIS